MTTYKIIRFYESDDFGPEVVERGLTLEAAQAWCRDPETSSATCTLAEGTLRTQRRGRWFEGWDVDSDALDPDDDLVDLGGSCPACGEPIDYCQGHGEIGDPMGFAILQRHDDGDHASCDPQGCEDAPR